MYKHKDYDPILRHVLKRPLPNNAKIMWEGVNDAKIHTTVYFIDLPASLFTMLIVDDDHGDLAWTEIRCDTASQRADEYRAWEGVISAPITR